MTRLIEAESRVSPVGLRRRARLSLQLQGTFSIVRAFVGFALAGAAARVCVGELGILLLAHSRKHCRALSDQELHDIIQPDAVVEKGVSIFHLQGKQHHTPVTALGGGLPVHNHPSRRKRLDAPRQTTLPENQEQ